MGFTSSVIGHGTGMRADALLLSNPELVSTLTSSPCFPSLFFFFFFYLSFFVIWHSLPRYKYQPNLKIRANEELGSCQEPKTTLSMLPPFQTSSPTHSIINQHLGLPRTISTAGCFLYHFQRSPCRYGCFVPEGSCYSKLGTML